MFQTVEFDIIRQMNSNVFLFLDGPILKEMGLPTDGFHKYVPLSPVLRLGRL